MANYGKLADIYDYLVGSVDYEGWVDYIEAILSRYGHSAHRVVDLACGTGNTTLPLVRRGYQATGVDLSGEMLSLAREKASQQGLKADFLEQNMCTLALPAPVDLITSYHDGMNYLVEPNDLAAVFQRVYENLEANGMFIFDLVNVHKLKGMQGGTTFVDEEKMSLIWETVYFADKDIWEVTLTGFIKKDDLYEKFQEVHREKGYSTEEVVQMLKQAGLTLLDILEAYSFNQASEDTYRKFYIVKKARID